jgi:hypothetical protein
MQQQPAPPWMQVLPWLQNLVKSIGNKRQYGQKPLGFPQTDIPYRTEQLVSQGMPRNRAEVIALQEAEMARKKELSKLPTSVPKRMKAGAEYLNPK